MHPAKSNGRDHPYVEWRPGVCGREPVIVGTGFPRPFGCHEHLSPGHDA